MSEEVKNEQQPQAETQAPAGPIKNKKVNRLLASEVSSKIEEFEKNGMIHSRYYLHLVERKKQLGA